MSSKYKNFKYMDSMQLILSNTVLTEDQEREYMEVYNSFKQKKLNRGYEYILKDLYKLTKIHNLSNQQLSNVYCLSEKSVSNLLSESCLLSILESRRKSTLTIERNTNYEDIKPKKAGNKSKLEFKNFIYEDKELKIIENTIIDDEDKCKIEKLKEVTLNSKYVYIYEDIYKLFKNNYSPAEIANVYGKSSGTLQLMFKKSGLARDRWEAQAIAKTKRNYKEIQLKGRKTMNENLTMINGSSYEQYIRNLLSFDLALKFKNLESIVGVNNKSILDNGNEIDIPIIIIGCNKMLKLAIEYDGLFWHENNDRDSIKEKLINEKGYKLFRIAPKAFATEKQIKEEIKIILDEIYNYISDFFYEENNKLKEMTKCS